MAKPKSNKHKQISKMISSLINNDFKGADEALEDLTEQSIAHRIKKASKDVKIFQN